MRLFSTFEKQIFSSTMIMRTYANEKLKVEIYVLILKHLHNM